MLRLGEVLYVPLTGDANGQTVERVTAHFEYSMVDTLFSHI